MAQKLAPAEKNSTDISAASATFASLSALKYVDTVQEQEQDKYVLGFSLYL